MPRPKEAAREDLIDMYRMFDSAFSPPASATDTEIQRKHVNFRGNSRMIKKRVIEDCAATEPNANKERNQNLRANEDY
jgi:hypothetical protein